MRDGFMTFLHPVLLYGLFLAAIPIIIHLFARRKRRIIEFSTLLFLKLIENKRLKKLKLQQLFLLFARTLAIIFLVLAFSRPALKGTIPFSIGKESKTAAVFIIDNTMSMGYELENSIFLTKIKEALSSLLNSYKSSDELYLLVASDNLQSGIQSPIYQVERLKELVNDISLSFNTCNLGTLLKQACEILEKSSNFNKEIIFVSDLQSSNFINMNGDHDSLLVEEEITLFCLTDDILSKSNLAISQVKFLTQIPEKNKELEIEATVDNWSSSPASDLVLSLYLDNVRMAQNTVSIKEGSSTSIRFRFIPGKTGLLEGFLEMESDNLPADNRYYFDIYIPETIRILLTYNNRNIAADYIKLAFSPEDSSSGLPISVDEFGGSTFAGIDLYQYDVIIFASFDRLPDTEVVRLQEFLSQGKGIILFLDSRSNIQNYNSGIAKMLGLPSIVDTMVKSSNQKDFLTFGRVDYQHPIFKGIFNSPQTEISSPKFYFTHTLEKSLNSEPVISFSNGNSFLEEIHYQGGRILVFTSSPHPELTDFSHKGIFAPIITRIAYYLASEPLSEKESFRIGDEVTFGTRIRGDNYYVQKPDGENEKLTLDIQSNLYFLRFNKTAEPGIYRFYVDKKLLENFSVNVPPEESPLQTLPIRKLRENFSKVSVINLNEDDDPQAVISQTRYGREFGNYFFIFCFLLLGLEMWIQRAKKEDMIENQNTPSS